MSEIKCYEFQMCGDLNCPYPGGHYPQSISSTSDWGLAQSLLHGLGDTQAIRAEWQRRRALSNGRKAWARDIDARIDAGAWM